MFLPEDTDGALALQQDEDLLCSGCGHPRDESMAPSAQDQYMTRFVTCHACAERVKGMADMNENGEPGLQLVVERMKPRGD